MKKNDLKYGNVVELRNGFKFLVFGDSDSLIKIKLIRLEGCGCATLDNWLEDLTDTEGCEKFDITKVYEDYTCKELLWERKEKPPLTEDEKVILKNVPKHYEWIARDSDGHLYIYASEPEKGLTIWKSCGLSMASFDHLFQFIQWKDEEPYLIEELLKEEE